MGEFEYEAGGGAPRLYVAGSGATGVAVLHPWWGLNEDVIAYAERLVRNRRRDGDRTRLSRCGYARVGERTC